MKQKHLIFRVDQILKEKDLTIREFSDKAFLEYTFEFRVGEILKKKKLSTAQFAKLAGVHYNTALAIVNNNYKRIGLDTLAQMCAALKVKVEDLFEIKQIFPAVADDQKVGLHYNTALAIVNNNFKRVGLDTLAQICRGLDVTIDELFEWGK